MSQNVLPRRLRPYLFTSFRRVHHPSSRLYHASTIVTSARDSDAPPQEGRKVTNDYERRVSHLESVSPAEQWYPRTHQSRDTQTRIEQFRHRHYRLQDGETDKDVTITLTGRIHSVRTAGNKLLFIDVRQGNHGIQGVVDFAKVRTSTPDDANTSDAASRTAFKNLSAIARKGDVFSIRGHPHRTPRGELSALCTELPDYSHQVYTKSPDALDPETRAHKRHVEMLVDPTAIHTLKIRHAVTKSLTSFLDAEGFTSVQTPILTSSAGGAIARPFETEATEFAGEKLQLRIAPELWLKRLIVGGMEKVYEFGPAFRNEGVDATHNPEFYICEFYEAYATLDDLMAKTENMLHKISADVRGLRPSSGKGSKDDAFTVPRFETPFQRIEFIPTLEQRLGHPLPDLTSSTATDSLAQIFSTHNLPLPSNPTLPRLLDALCAHYLEPLSITTPTFITHHPAILSPLAKTFRCPTTHQPVAARAELFVAGAELANMYEEENSPFAQRAKFVQQAKLKAGGEEGMELDESYLEALEWGCRLRAAGAVVSIAWSCFLRAGRGLGMFCLWRVEECGWLGTEDGKE